MCITSNRHCFGNIPVNEDYTIHIPVKILTVFNNFTILMCHKMDVCLSKHYM